MVTVPGYYLALLLLINGFQIIKNFIKLIRYENLKKQLSLTC